MMRYYDNANETFHPMWNATVVVAKILRELFTHNSHALDLIRGREKNNFLNVFSMSFLMPSSSTHPHEIRPKLQYCCCCAVNIFPSFIFASNIVCVCFCFWFCNFSSFWFFFLCISHCVYVCFWECFFLLLLFISSLAHCTLIANLFTVLLSSNKCKEGERLKKDLTFRKRFQAHTPKRKETKKKTPTLNCFELNQKLNILRVQICTV